MGGHRRDFLPKIDLTSQPKAGGFKNFGTQAED
jgi:hypothetical protein